MQESKESFHPRDWFMKADADIRTARILLSAGELGTASFHVQQALEKYLKGFLLERGWSLKRTHDLVDLLNEAVLFDNVFEKFRSLCEMVTEFYVEDRYPFLMSSELNSQEIDEALKKTEELLNFIKEKLG